MAERKTLPPTGTEEANGAWRELPWRKLEKYVYRIQKRIYRARKPGNQRQVEKLQKLLKLALEPAWEAVFEPNSYGFRPGRSCHDAIRAIFLGIRYKPKYVFDADIKGCFGNIDHEALLKKLNSHPKLTHLIKGWRKRGGHGRGRLHPHRTGNTSRRSDLTLTCQCSPTWDGKRKHSGEIQG